MIPKPIKKALRFFENLLFITVQDAPSNSPSNPPPSNILRYRSCNDLTVESQPCDDLMYASLRFPKKKAPTCHELEAGVSPGSNLPTEQQLTFNLNNPCSPALPVLLHMNELEDLISKMERNSSEIDKLEKRVSADSIPLSIKDYPYVETFV